MDHLLIQQRAKGGPLIDPTARIYTHIYIHIYRHINLDIDIDIDIQGVASIEPIEK